MRAVIAPGSSNARGRGTLFLDEIHSLSRKAQVSLLRFLQDMQYERVGGGTLKTADVRVVVASNVDLTDFQRGATNFAMTCSTGSI